MKEFIIPIFCILLLSCQTPSGESSNQTSGIFQKLNKKEFAQKLEEKKDAILIDVRTSEEYQAGTIMNAVNINYYDDNFDAQISKLDKSQPVFIFCKSGGRSGKTLRKLEKMGFTEVYDLLRGYSGWKK